MTDHNFDLPRDRALQNLITLNKEQGKSCGDTLAAMRLVVAPQTYNDIVHLERRVREAYADAPVELAVEMIFQFKITAPDTPATWQKLAESADQMLAEFADDADAYGRQAPIVKRQTS